MKTVGKQMLEARLAKNWTPELAARETKIKVDRLHDLEADDYSHFTSPTYARGFVRTYARALGLDEYKILRQLDNKLPDDDSSNIVTDSGVAYLPENSMPPRVAHRNYAGLYIVMALGGIVSLVIAVVLFKAYQVGELDDYFASSARNSNPVAPATHGAPVNPAETASRALPVDPNAVPPPAVDTTTPPTAPAAAGDMPSVRALPVDPSALTGSTNSAPGADATVKAMRALPVNPADLTNAPSATSINPPVTQNGATPPRALPVDPNELAAATPPVNPIPTAVAPAPSTPKPPATPISARQSNSGPVIQPPSPPVVAPVVPVANSAALAAAATNNAPATPSAAEAGKRLVLTATQDSFVRVTAVGASDAEKPLYAAVLHSGQSVGFDGRKFSINVGIPSAVDIRLDGVNYGPHSDQEAPETFTVESHQP